MKQQNDPLCSDAIHAKVASLAHSSDLDTRRFFEGKILELVSTKLQLLAKRSSSLDALS